MALSRALRRLSGTTTKVQLASPRALQVTSRATTRRLAMWVNTAPSIPDTMWQRMVLLRAAASATAERSRWATKADCGVYEKSMRRAPQPCRAMPRESISMAVRSGTSRMDSWNASSASVSRSTATDRPHWVPHAVQKSGQPSGATWSQVVQYSYYSLAQPQAAQWSLVNHVTGDPQIPFAGDRPYEAPFTVVPRTDIDSMTDVTGWTRDASHLENTGFVHWLATEDPVAGLVVQRQAAFALASFAENFRTGLVSYRGSTQQERTVFNLLSALWKSREVSRRVTSTNGRVFWNLARADRQATEVIADYDQIRVRLAAATPTSSGANIAADYVNNIAGSLFNATGVGPWDMQGGGTQNFAITSNFMPAQYAAVPMWLWAKSGNASVRQMMIAYARGFVVRLNTVGGTMGVDGLPDQRGSGIAIGPSVANNFNILVPAEPPFSTTVGWGQWLVTQPFLARPSRTTFDAVGIHTATQMEGMLLFARDLTLPITDLDTAISRVSAAKAASNQATYRFQTIYGLKHMSAPN